MRGNDGQARNRAQMRTPADFGLAIQQARLAQGLSQNQLAARLNIPQATLSQIEGGKSTIFMRRLLEIMRATGIDLTATWEETSDATGR